MRIGTTFTGKVDTLGQESIQTKFFLLGLPLIPLESYYSLHQTLRGVQGYPIDLNMKSVFVAYVRWWVGLASILGTIFALGAKNYGFVPLPLAGVALTLSTIWIGRLPIKEKNRRQVLSSVVGMGAPPNLLQPSTRYEIKFKLEKEWKESSFGSSHLNWRNIASLDAVPGNVLPLLFSLALYNQDDQLAESVWQAIETYVQSNDDSADEALVPKELSL